MANTYSQIHLHFVFAPKYRSVLIQPAWENELYKYISGTTEANKHKLLAINGMHDHVHLLVGFRPAQSISDFMQDVKSGSSKWINDQKLLQPRFEWQAGYGVFSYSKSQVPEVIRYIAKQKEHHRKVSFREEYKLFLQKFEVEFEEKYIFQEPE